MRRYLEFITEKGNEVNRASVLQAEFIIDEISLEFEHEFEDWEVRDRDENTYVTKQIEGYIHIDNDEEDWTKHLNIVFYLNTRFFSNKINSRLVYETPKMMISFESERRKNIVKKSSYEIARDIISGSPSGLSRKPDVKSFYETIPMEDWDKRSEGIIDEIKKLLNAHD